MMIRTGAVVSVALDHNADLNADFLECWNHPSNAASRTAPPETTDSAGIFVVPLARAGYCVFGA